MSRKDGNGNNKGKEKENKTKQNAQLSSLLPCTAGQDSLRGVDDVCIHHRDQDLVHVFSTAVIVSAYRSYTHTD